MIPYLEPSDLILGSFHVHPARLLVAAAIVLGHFLLLARARKQGLDPTVAAIFSTFLIGGGLLFGHWFKLLYWPGAWARALEHPVLLFSVGFGQASLGGLLGGLACGLLFLWWKAPRAHLLPYLDVLAQVFPFAWLVGRMHCVLVHDHPGMRTANWLGVRYPDGVRFDLAVIEILFLLALIPFFRYLERQPRAPGTYCGVFLLSYGIFRVFLDQLHVDVVRYLGLSMDQWGSGAAVLAGALVLAAALRPVSFGFAPQNSAWSNQFSA